MKNRLIILLSGVLILNLTSCLRDLLCVNGDGIIEEEVRRVTSFNQINNSTSFEVIYKRADTSGIRIRAEQNIINYIETNVYNDCLEITTSPGSICLDYTEQPVITITSPALDKAVISGSGSFFADSMEGVHVFLKMSGSGDISVDEVLSDNCEINLTGSGNINVKQLISLSSDFQITGSGDITVTGSCDESHLRIPGSGNIYAGNFPVNTSSVIISGSGNAFTDIDDYLNGLISGSGNIYVKGDPEIDQTITGSGRIIKLK